MIFMVVSPCFKGFVTGKWWPLPDSNRGPNDYESVDKITGKPVIDHWW
jgi:hypothetical protein